ERLRDTPEARDARAIFQRGFYRPVETWFGPDGEGFNPGNYYYVGGNTKFYGAVLLRYRKEDFHEMEFPGGEISPAWPIGYEELEPWYGKAESLYRVRGAVGEDPTEPPHSTGYPFPPVPDEPAIARVRERLTRAGARPFSLPLGVDINAWLARAKTPWDAFPDSFTGKMDAETCGLATALADPDITIEAGAEVLRLETGAHNRIAAVVYRKDGAEVRLAPHTVILSAGAVQSAALLLKSANGNNPDGLANRSGQVGRNFMNHNSSALLASDPRERNDSVYQKTLGINDFYLDDGRGGGPLGNIQLLGRLSGPILKANIKWPPEWALNAVSSRTVDWYLMSEDLPRAESRVTVQDGRIVLDWQRSNMTAHRELARRAREVFRSAGYPVVLIRPFDRRTPSHQCGTVRMGNDPASSAVDTLCRCWDHPNLYVVDASFLPTSAAVNPALTIAAQALRSAAHIRATELAA
ncbi:MAG: GMC family oxidoreductase, partial [Pseudomonadota bacterium]|nr:GMC family oxidoreductase [Pseudomonadota bacterium]